MTRRRRLQRSCSSAGPGRDRPVLHNCQLHETSHLHQPPVGLVPWHSAASPFRRHLPISRWGRRCWKAKKSPYTLRRPDRPGRLHGRSCAVAGWLRRCAVWTVRVHRSRGPRRGAAMPCGGRGTCPSNATMSPLQDTQSPSGYIQGEPVQAREGVWLNRRRSPAPARRSAASPSSQRLHQAVRKGEQGRKSEGGGRTASRAVAFQLAPAASPSAAALPASRTD